jgi:hypothetical protein
MKFIFYILIPPLFLWQTVFAQQPVVTKVNSKTYRQQITAGPVFPLGTFSETHFPGITASYIRIMDKLKMKEPARLKKTGWVMAASISHFPGRKEIIGNGSYRYSGYSILDLQGGLGWYPEQKISFLLRSGPGLGYYSKIFRFTVTGQLQGSYTISPKTTITPGLSFIKEPGSDALWSPSLQLGILF